MNPMLIAILIVTTYCAQVPNKDQCRAERIACIKSAAGTKIDDAILIDDCLRDPHSHVATVPAKPAAKPAKK